jgi:hypothetical protein
VATTVYSHLPREKVKTLRTKGEVELSEEEGIRLALVVRGASALNDVSRTSSYAAAVYELIKEEAYYWFAKTSNGSARRGIRALRILLGGVE